MISVCLATYNGEKYILEQLYSILSQLGDHDEVILSDDRSSDDTVERIRQIGDPRIKIYENAINRRGYTRNFENALVHASGDYVFLCDQDDVWHEDKVAKTIEVLQRCDFTVSDANVVDENRNVIYPSHFARFNTKSGFLENLVRTRYIGACMAFRRNVLLKALPFPKNEVHCAHDYWLAIVAECFFTVELIREPLIDYRRHGANASSGGLAKSKSSVSARIMKRIYSLWMLFRLAFRGGTTR